MRWVTWWGHMIRRHHQALRQMVSVNREDSHWSTPCLTSILRSLSSFSWSVLSLNFCPSPSLTPTQLFISLFLHLFQSIFSRSLTHPSFYSPLCSLSICFAVFYLLSLFLWPCCGVNVIWVWKGHWSDWGLLLMGSVHFRFLCRILHLSDGLRPELLHIYIYIYIFIKKLFPSKCIKMEACVCMTTMTWADEPAGQVVEVSELDSGFWMIVKMEMEQTAVVVIYNPPSYVLVSSYVRPRS